MSECERIVAVSLLTEKELRRFGEDLKLVYPVPSESGFEDLLARIAEVAGERPRRR
jgi:hypothetical protein